MTEDSRQAGPETIYVGMDVHKATIAVALASPGQQRPRFWGTIANTPEAVRKLVGKLGEPAQLDCAYEAGPTGYGLQRQLSQLGAACLVAAPSLILRKQGDRVKTDRRDAEHLAEQLRNHTLTAVHIPDHAQEALRDLTRAREDAQQEVVRSRNRLGKLLLRLGVAPADGVRAHTQAHASWLRQLRLPQPLQQTLLDEYRAAVHETQARVKRLEQALGDAPLQGTLAAQLGAVQAFRGVARLTGTTLMAELGDLRRFATPQQLMAYAGLVPSEHASGPRTLRGRITKTGNRHLRYSVIEAVWHYQHSPRIGAALQRRQAGQPASVIAIAWKAQQRLYRRYHRLVKRGKTSQQAITAVAREFLGFVWAAAQQVAACG
jgi:transposase